MRSKRLLAMRAWMSTRRERYAGKPSWIAKENNNPAYGRARDLLREAENILLPEIADEEAKREMGRVYTLFCEMRCNLGRPGRLRGRRSLELAYMKNVTMHRRDEEPGVEAYGKERAKEWMSA